LLHPTPGGYTGRGARQGGRGGERKDWDAVALSIWSLYHLL